MWIVYTRRPSGGGRELARALGGVVAGDLRNVGRDDVVVCWGFTPSEQSVDLSAPRLILNRGAGFHSKFFELSELSRRGIPVPEFTATPRTDWLPRRARHSGGRDFTSPPCRGAAFWVEPLDISEEWRFHIVGGISVRAGKKVWRRGGPPPLVGGRLIRSHRLGWGLSYGGSPAPDGLREISKQAVRALDLDFGAVDTVVTTSGERLVLEVNTAPGLEGGTPERYAAGLRRLEGGDGQ